ncbi:39S ribosomal protein L35, mitochondrial [Ceratina calcarata]|uniref:Large ribosomal subunit protein bL35m n=1 Tax=Ceratina calcarata TaxID=156304 RepID=A0AAJ7IVE8_9HYME|nr:39S ribosomal protein L35, mitochondrial [Ceratina calcarata]
MLRIVNTAVRDIVSRTKLAHLATSLISKQSLVTQCVQQRFFGAFSSTINNWSNVSNIKRSDIFGQAQINNVVPLTLTPNTTPVRTVIKYSRHKGKRKTVKPVVERFYRLNWGIWIRTRAGRHKRLWKKSGKLKHKYKMHVFCNATQSAMLDKMVTKYWKRPHYYVDDPYNPYHEREEFPITRKKPRLFP